MPHGRGPNCSCSAPTRSPGTEQLVGDLGRRGRAYKGKISIYDDSIFIADAALYLKATQPDLGIENPYQLTQEQFDAAVALLKSSRRTSVSGGRRLREADPVVREQGQRDRHDVADCRSTLLKGDEPAGRGHQADGGHDGLVGHVDDPSQRRQPELHVPLDGPHDVAEDAGGRRRGLRRGARQPEGVRADEEPEPLHGFHADDETWWEDVYYWDDADRGLRWRPGGTCVTQEDWRNAWTEIRG